jgi:hypothetical protein
VDSDGSGSPRRRTWIVFFLFGVLLTAHAIYMMILPSADPDHWEAFTTDPVMIAYLADEFRSAGAMQLGFGIFSMVIAARWFRRGDRWAWFAFWYFPILFVWSMFTTWALPVFLILAVCAAGSLLLSASRTRQAVASARTRRSSNLAR